MSRPLKVLMTLPSFLRTASPFREVYTLAKFLDAERVRLTICGLRRDGFAAEDGARAGGPLLRKLGLECFVARFRPRGHRLRHLRSWIADQAIIRARGPFDLQHSMDFKALPLEGLAACAAGRPFLFSQRSLHPGQKRLLLRLKIRLARRVVAISEGTQALVEELGGGDRVRLVRNGFALEALDPEGTLETKAEVAAPYLLTVGSVIPLKRQGDAIRILARLAPERPRLRLKIAGALIDPTHRQRLEGLALGFGIADRVEILGERDDIPHLLRDAEALVHCSAAEAFGWAVVEAMAVGTPVVAARASGPVEVLRHEVDGLLVEVGEIEGFCAMLRRLHGSPSLRDRLVTAASHRVAEHFSPALMADAMAAIYEELVSHHE